MRRLIAFPCEGDTLIGTLDEAAGATGLLIVSGGNEVRSGAHRGMALLAARLAAQGFPVFRFDRRGVGDSTGENRGYAASGPDIRAAAACFRREVPSLKRLIGMGNCDAALALTFYGKAAGIDALILTNPWLPTSGPAGLSSAPAIRARYAARLRDPRSWTRPPNFRKFGNGLRAMLGETPQAGPYARSALPRAVILARSDPTARTFRAAVHGAVTDIDTSSHSFADAADELEAAVLDALRRYSAA